jgi:hypothetical protein
LRDDHNAREGTRNFLRFTWPTVKRAIPAAELTIAGPAAASIRCIDPQITMFADLGALDSFFSEARIAVNPSLAGDQATALISLAHFRSVVCWPNGVAGISPSLLRFCCVASNWVEFTRHTVSLLSSGDAPLADPAERGALRQALQPDLSLS